MFFVNSPRPIALEIELQRFRFSRPLCWCVAGLNAEFYDALEGVWIIFYPPFQILKASFSPGKF